ncbi:MAG: methylenetetrahydrofolate reductase C-terminal domain-containing protein [Phototrophicaceae bacterium]
MSVFRKLQDQPKLLERAYQWTHKTVRWARPILERIGYERVEPVFVVAEEISKKAIFNCQMCGQCTLHTTGMTCPMNCPKNLRNGPCGGVRHDGHCEVKPEMPCVWLQAWERSANMTIYADDIMIIQPPLDRRQEGKSAFINMVEAEKRGLPTQWQAIIEHDVEKHG